MAGLLLEYLDYVIGELALHFGISMDARDAFVSTMAKADDLIAPRGRSFVARLEDGALVGMVFLRPCGARAVEIKRLYVRAGGRGLGVGRALVARAIEAARQMGANAIYLDSAKNLTAALALYEDMGFRYCEPYLESDQGNDPRFAEAIVFMKMTLS